MESKHTPGPWATMRLESQTGWVILRRVDENHAQGPVFALVDATTGVPGDTEANARLIAAAPELLAALKELRDMAKQYHRERYARMSQNDQSEFLRCERLAAAAIARAEGGC